MFAILDIALLITLSLAYRAGRRALSPAPLPKAKHACMDVQGAAVLWLCHKDGCSEAHFAGPDGNPRSVRYRGWP